MEPLELLLVGIGFMLVIWVASAPIRNKNKRPGTTGQTTEGRIIHQKEWLHEGHRHCQIEYAFTVSNPETGEAKTLRGKRNYIPDIFDRLELNSAIKVRYLPQKPEFSRPLFD